MIRKFSLLLTIFYVILLLACFKKVPLTVESSAFYNKYQLFFTKQERKLFKGLPDKKSQEEFMKEFWEVRDPNPATEENELKKEIDERIDYADRFFEQWGKSGHQTDRGRVYLLLGPPDDIISRREKKSHLHTAILTWHYERWGVSARFIDKYGSGVFRLNNYDLRFLKLLNRLKHANLNYDDTSIKELDMKLIDPVIKYNRTRKALSLQFREEELAFKQQGKSYMIKIKIEGRLYKGSTFKQIFKIQEIKGDAGDFLKKKNKLIVDVPLPDLQGKVVANILITDMIAKNKIRKIFKFKIR